MDTIASCVSLHATAVAALWCTGCHDADTDVAIPLYKHSIPTGDQAEAKQVPKQEAGVASKGVASKTLERMVRYATYDSASLQARTTKG